MGRWILPGREQASEFGGVYMRDCRDEFPDDWFECARLTESARDLTLNFYETGASQPLAEWRRKGWIFDQFCTRHMTAEKHSCVFYR